MSGIPTIKYTLSQLTCLYQFAEVECQLPVASMESVGQDRPLVMGLSVM